VRRLAVLALVLLAALPAAAPAGSSGTELRITLWPRGKGGSPYRWVLRCNPADGTLPDRRVACAKLNRTPRPFAPVPPNTACTEQYGGPAEARVTGRYRGRRVWAHFNRADGCRIARWDKHAFLFGGVPLASG
jgi:hypothetical protein